VVRRHRSSIGGSAQARASSYDQHTLPRDHACMSHSQQQAGAKSRAAAQRHLLELVVWARRVRHRPLQTDVAVHLVEVLPQLRKPHRPDLLVTDGWGA